MWTRVGGRKKSEEKGKENIIKINKLNNKNKKISKNNQDSTRKKKVNKARKLNKERKICNL